MRETKRRLRDEIADLRTALVELKPVEPQVERMASALKRVEALAESYEVTAERRRGLAEKWSTNGRITTADEFARLAQDSQHHADRIRAAIAAPQTGSGQ